MSFQDQLQPASWSGVPFGVIGGQARFGRRNAIHEYAFRDTVWVEDLGRAARRIGLVGFLVENSLIYGGGDVIAQRELLIARAEQAADGELIHPTLGRLTVSLLDLQITERWDEGRVFELGFSFIESGQRLFPSTVTSTTDAVASAAGAADAAAGADFAARSAAALKSGFAVVQQAVRTTAQWTAVAQRLAGDATSLTRLAAALPGSFGRYQSGRSSSSFAGAALPVLSGLTSIQALESKAAQARGTVTAAIANAGTAAGAL